MKQRTNHVSQAKYAEILKALINNQRALSYQEVQTFSDLEEDRLTQFAQVWANLAENRKEMLIELMLVESMSNTVMDFSSVAYHSLHDPNAFIRRGSLKLLAENRKNAFLDQVIALSKNDPDEYVRLEAIAILGYFLLDTDVSDRHHHKADRVLKALEELQDAPDLNTRLQVMEAMAFIDHPSIIPMIRSSLASSDELVLSAGLRAVQNSLNKRWADDVIDNLDHPNPDVQIEAIKAAGQLQLTKARTTILRMLAVFDQVDDEVLDALIIAASQLGGYQAKEMISILEDLFDDEDDMVEIFEEAKSNLELVEFQNELAQNPDLKDVFYKEDESESDEMKEDEENFIELLQEHIQNLQTYEEPDDEEEDSDEEGEESHSHHRPYHSHNPEAGDIDWNRFRIIEDIDKENDLLDEEDFEDSDSDEEYFEDFDSDDDDQEDDLN